MNCPFCANPAFEGVESCPHCGFSLNLLDRIYGAIPRLSPELCDDAHIFHPRQIKRLSAAMSAFHQSFPQSFFHLLTVKLTAMENLRAYAFWLFNRANLSNELHRGAGNHDVLLTIDAANQRASLIVGYGLEPFVNNEHLDYALTAGADSLATGKYYDGCRKIIAQTTRTLARIATDLNQTYGISVTDLHAQEIQAAASPDKNPVTPPY